MKTPFLKLIQFAFIEVSSSFVVIKYLEFNNLIQKYLHEIELGPKDIKGEIMESS